MRISSSIMLKEGIKNRKYLALIRTKLVISNYKTPNIERLKFVSKNKICLTLNLSTHFAKWESTENTSLWKNAKYFSCAALSLGLTEMLNGTQRPTNVSCIN